MQAHTVYWGGRSALVAWGVWDLLGARISGSGISRGSTENPLLTRPDPPDCPRSSRRRRSPPGCHSCTLRGGTRPSFGAPLLGPGRQRRWDGRWWRVMRARHVRVRGSVRGACRSSAANRVRSRWPYEQETVCRRRRVFVVVFRRHSLLLHSGHPRPTRHQTARAMSEAREPAAAAESRCRPCYRGAPPWWVGTLAGERPVHPVRFLAADPLSLPRCRRRNASHLKSLENRFLL